MILLFDEAEDIRTLSFMERRRRLELWYERFVPSLADVSALVDFEDFAALDALWRGARAEGIEGLMLKRKDSPYLAGRPKGHWFKWKRAALTLDCVLMYAQRGSGKRSSYYSDYTFGVWDGDKLVPVGKAYSGFTDEELLRLDRWIRNNTVERFGPVRAVTPGLVLEVAFDAVQPSGRHKSGRRDALSAHPPHPLGQARRRGRYARNDQEIDCRVIAEAAAVRHKPTAIAFKMPPELNGGSMNNRKLLRIAVLFGGRSAEHDVSILSATNVVRAMSPSKYDVVPIFVTREGQWFLSKIENDALLKPASGTELCLVAGGRGTDHGDPV